jgi:hypothetical protein
MPSRASRPAVAAVLVTAAAFGFAGGAVVAQQIGALVDPEVAATGEPTPTEEATPKAGISLSADPGSATTNQDVRLEGSLAPAVGGVALQVERSLDGGDWQEFPVTTTSREDGTFGVTVRTSRSGENRFRVVGTVEGAPMASNEVPVSIG